MPESRTTKVEWTTSRCFRILRPIASRRASNNITQQPRECRPIRQNHDRSATSRTRFGDSPNPRCDPDWIAKPSKRGQRQYVRSTPVSSDPVQDLKPGLLSLSTPFIQRIRGTATLSQPSSSNARPEHSLGRGTSSLHI